MEQNPMKRMLAISTILFTFCLRLLGLQSVDSRNLMEGSDTQRELQQLENRRNEAMLHGDAAFLDRTTADDFTAVTPSGQLGNKTQMLGDIKSHHLKYEKIAIDSLSIRVYGNTAVLVGERTIRGEHNGKRIDGQDRFTRVYTKQNGRWQCVAFQSTRTAGP